MNEKIKSPSNQGGGAGPPASAASNSSATGGNNSGSAATTNAAVAAGTAAPTTTCITANNNAPAPIDPQAAVVGAQPPPPPPHAYGPPPGIDPAMSHYHMHQPPPPQHMSAHQQSMPQQQNPNAIDHANKDEYGNMNPHGVPPPPPPSAHHSVYGRYHHADPNIDPYRHPYAPMQQAPPPPPPTQSGGKPQAQSASGNISSANRPPPQRYIPGQPPQGPTPTLNSLLQSTHPPPPPQHRYSNSYDPQAQQQQAPQGAQPQQQTVAPQGGPHGPPPPPHQPYGTQQGGWAPPPRPYSPQMGPSQVYRTPPPQTSSRGQSPYPPAHGQNSGSYPSSPQQQQPQPGGPPPPPPQSSNQGTAATQYSPYPQRYPTPPGPGPATGPNHRTAYPTHQYTEPNRPWPGGSSPAPSPGPGGSAHPHPPASPHHQSQHGGPPPSSSPGHAPSPSPQPSQASPSPHQELIGQNSNDSSSGGGHSGMGSGPPGTPNSQQVMRPTPSPTGSSGSRSMSPAVAQNHPISRPASNQSSSGPMQQQSGPGGGGVPPPPMSHMLPAVAGNAPPPTPQQQQGGMAIQQQSQQCSSQQNSSSSASNSPQQQQQQQQQPQQQQLPPNQTVNNMPTPPPPQTGVPAGYPPPPPHMHNVYKMSAPMPGAAPAPQGYQPPQQSQQYSQGNYPPRPQYPPNSYAPTAPPASQPNSANNMPPGGHQQYAGRPMPNHSSAYAPYQNWAPPPQASAPPPVAPGNAPPNIGNHVQGKGTPPPVGAPPQQVGGAGGGGSPRPLNYLKQHLQHKGGYVGAPTPPQGYGNGPGMHPGMPMGPPPHHMGPPHGPTSMGPPTSTPPQIMGVGLPADAGGNHEHISQDNGISSSGSSTASGSHPVTSIVTTGPDGAPIDEVSQQSTLSNASAASMEDSQCSTPKSRKNDPYGQSHLAPPSTSPVGHPAVHGMGAPGEEYEMNSPPNWTRTAASPVFNSHVPPQEPFRAVATVTAASTNKKSDSLCKLYEMDENPERPVWLDKLRAFMEDRRTPITACPTISKQPLDLFKLYKFVKERGGFVEVTKSKTWKDIAGALGIGASSSAAYTLRKHYTKNLLAFECHFDRGDIDPLPIIQQVEAGTKKKTTKAPSAPSPGGGMLDAANVSTASTGSSNSQDSFPAPGVVPNATMDGYAGYPSAYPGAGPGPQPDYVTAGQMQRPPSQTNAQTPHAGAPYPGQPSAYGQQYGTSDQYNSAGPPAQYTQNQGQFPPQQRNMYPPYGPEGEAPPPGANQYGPYGQRPYSQPPPAGAQAPPTPGANAAGPPTGAPVPPSGAYPGGAPTQQDYYRQPDQASQPRRHPDFVKDSQPYPGFNARPQMYGGWQGGSNQYRGQYPSAPSPQGWGSAPPRGAAPPPPPGAPVGSPNQQAAAAAAQWEQHRYPPQQAPPPQQQQQQPPYQQQAQPQPAPPPQWAQMAGAQPSATGPPGAALRPPAGAQQQQRMPSVVGAGMTAAPTNQQQATMPAVAQNIPTAGSMSKPPYVMPPPQVGGIGIAGGPAGATAANSMQTGMLGMSGKPPMSQSQLPAAGGAGISGGGGVVGGGGIGQQPQTTFPQPAAGAQLIKKEIVFPTDSVEATTPVLYRRKRLGKADVCPIDPWRIFMSIRSGLLGECTWALDVLNVMLFDDTTVQYFGLAYMPCLLTLLLEHFQKTLADMFGGEDENEDAAVKYARAVRSVCSYKRKQMQRTALKATVCETDEDEQQQQEEELKSEQWLDLGQVHELPNPDERVTLLPHTPNYTMISRKGMQVRVHAAEDDIFITDHVKPWDVDLDAYYEMSAAAGSDLWSYGCNEPYANDNIIDVFKSEIIDIPFARFIRSSKKSTTTTSTTTTTVTTITTTAEQKTDDEDADHLLAKFDASTPIHKVANAAAAVEEADTVTFKVEKDNDVAPTEQVEDFEDCTRLQQTFNKKRRYNNSSSQCKADETLAAKKSKVPTSDDADSNLFAQPEIKKERLEASSDTAATVVTNSDSDCREVDMEIESGGGTALAAASNNANNVQNGVADSNSSVRPLQFNPLTTVRDTAQILQRRRNSSYEDECYTRDEASLYLVNESEDSLARRCICLSNIFRNLSFVPGNETILAKSTRFLAIMGRLLLLNHEHLPRTPKTRNYDREEDTDFSDSCSSLQGESEWWWEYLISIRENMLVAMANIAGHLELPRYEELIARPLIDGLLHWAVCPSAHGQDPFPSCGPNSALSPQRLALEALCKLCVTDANVDLVIATPPFARLEKLCAVLTRHLCRNEDQVLREFSVNLLHYLAAADSAMARTVALQSPCISYLVAFIEQAEQTALGVANQHGINYLRENPDSMGTSLDMLRRAAGTLLHLAKHPDNRSLFMQLEPRLLGLVMSHILDQQVALVIARVLFQVSRGAATMPSVEYRAQQRQQNEANAASMLSSLQKKLLETEAQNKTTALMEIKSELKVEAAQMEAPTATTAPSAAASIEGEKNSSQTLSTSAATTTTSTTTTEDYGVKQEQLEDEAQHELNLKFNDVSNSSTNSNSCGTVASSHSNISSGSAASVNSNSSNQTTAATTAATIVTATTKNNVTCAEALSNSTVTASTNATLEQHFHQQQQQQQQTSSLLNKNGLGSGSVGGGNSSSSSSSSTSSNSSGSSNSNNCNNIAGLSNNSVNVATVSQAAQPPTATQAPATATTTAAVA